MRRRSTTVLIAAGLLIGGCSAAPEDRPVAPALTAEALIQAPGEHNPTDVMYLQMMVAHHEQGLAMARLATGRAGRSEVRILAGAVVATQADEVQMMRSWLQAWSEPATVDHAPAAHADHGGLPATGEQELEALHEAKGAAFETTFLNLFVAHQHNAVEMARMETTGGANAETKALAERIRVSRTEQIRQVLRLVNS